MPRSPSPRRRRSRERARERESERSSGYNNSRRGYDRDRERSRRYDDESPAREGSSSKGKGRQDEDDRRRERNGDRDRDRRDRDRDYGRGNEDRGGRRRRSPDNDFHERERDRHKDKQRERGDERYGQRKDRSRSRSPRRRSRSQSNAPSASAEDMAKPNFKPSGLLAAATNTVQLSDGTKTVLKYNEPPEARKPQIGWRLYVFKGQEQTDVLHISRQSAYLVGRDKSVVDIYVEHPSCSKQHAAIQFRQIQEKDEFGSVKAITKPFIIDLESTNGTIVNDEAIPTSRYYELKLSDVIKFGQSTREYVLLHDEV